MVCLLRRGQCFPRSCQRRRHQEGEPLRSPAREWRRRQEPALPRRRLVVARHHHPGDPGDGRLAHDPRRRRRRPSTLRRSSCAAAMRWRSPGGRCQGPPSARRTIMASSSAAESRRSTASARYSSATPASRHSRGTPAPANSAVGHGAGLRRLRARHLREGAWEHLPEPLSRPAHEALARLSLRQCRSRRSRSTSSRTRRSTSRRALAPASAQGAGHVALTPGGAAVHVGTIPLGAIILPVAHHLLVAVRAGRPRSALGDAGDARRAPAVRSR